MLSIVVGLQLLPGGSAPTLEPVDLHSPLPGAPDIVGFPVGDLGWQDVSLPLHTSTTPFNERCRTPNVERLARGRPQPPPPC